MDSFIRQMCKAKKPGMCICNPIAPLIRNSEYIAPTFHYLDFCVAVECKTKEEAIEVLELHIYKDVLDEISKLAFKSNSPYELMHDLEEKFLHKK